MAFIRSAARKVLFPFVISVGFEKLLSFFSLNKCIILMYHGVVKKADFSLSNNHLSLEDFEKHLRYLKRNFAVIPLQEMFEAIRNRKQTSKKTIAITFDDGYENNFTNAFPLLKAMNMPATIFVAATCVNTPDDPLWYDQVDLCKNEIDITSLKKHNVSSVDDLKSFLKHQPTIRKKEILDEVLKDILPKKKKAENKEFHTMLSANQLKELAASPLIEIGSHTVTHPNLDQISESDLHWELKTSKSLLESATGKKIISIAFPDGAYNEKVKKASLECDYKNLLAVDFRVQSDKTDPDILPRFCISNTTTMESNMTRLHSSFSTTGF